MFPNDWDAYSGPNRKKPKTFFEGLGDRAGAAATEEPVGFVSDLQNGIRRSLNQEGSRPEPAADLDMDHVLARVPYRDMLENLFGEPSGEEAAPPELPIITKVYEESFMRQPTSGEQACVMGEQCEARFIDRQAPFTCVEFRLPGDPATPQMCVLCSRRATQKMFYDM